MKSAEKIPRYVLNRFAIQKIRVMIVYPVGLSQPRRLGAGPRVTQGERSQDPPLFAITHPQVVEMIEGRALRRRRPFDVPRFGHDLALISSQFELPGYLLRRRNGHAKFLFFL
jgi:hypothetical protein